MCATACGEKEKQQQRNAIIKVLLLLLLWWWFLCCSLVCENKQEKFCCIYSPSPPHHLVGRSVININVNNARQQHNGLKVKWCCLFILTLKRLWMYVGFYFCSNIPPVGLFFYFLVKKTRKNKWKSRYEISPDIKPNICERKERKHNITVFYVSAWVCVYNFAKKKRKNICYPFTPQHKHLHPKIAWPC